MIRYDRSLWLDRFPKSRVPSYPKHRGALQTDVVIVGGGLTGCATAYAFAAAGIRVTLLEADRLGRGMIGASTGWISDVPGPSFRSVERVVGLRAARRGWQTWRRAALDFNTLLRRLGVKCQATPVSSILLARTPEQAHALKREAKDRKEAGLDVSILNARAASSETRATALAALRTREAMIVDPYRATLGLASAAGARGATLFEQSPATGITFSAKAVDVQTAGGTVRADRVVVATGRPTPLFKALVRHFWYHSAFAVVTEPIPAKVRRSIGPPDSVLWDAETPPHFIRWVDDDRLLISGADTAMVPDRRRAKTIVQRTGQLMYELSILYPEISGLLPAYGWEIRYGRTSDGLSYIGPHRNFPRHLFAFGNASASVTDAYMASRILLRHYQGHTGPDDDVFGFTTSRL